MKTDTTIPLDIWTVHEDGFSPTTGRPLAKICDMYNRKVADRLLKEDADLIVEAVNEKF